ncbi:hypothetical protein TRAPUB_4916 [Trametes pubescens]|uniref:Uncharacterized protein n=1 Tax=Trametes pubescens TaxID=154538 RepID=A0A1M2VA23_TRAPU|nr:hypothetical protein TRAPUB_4916 [Trametes pubescens]
MPKLNIPVLHRVIPLADMEQVVANCRPASFTRLTVNDEDMQERVDGIFAWFAQDVQAMKAVLRDSRAFIAGSLALTLFCPVRFEPSNADIFVPHTHIETVLHHLTTTQSLVIESTSVVNRQLDVPLDPTRDERITTYGAGILEIRRLRRGEKCVNVYTFLDTSPLTVNTDILNFTWATLLMNYVTADYACCAYPSMTFLGRGLYHMNRWTDPTFPGDNSHHLLNTYAERGFELSRHPSGWYEGLEDRCEGGWSCPFEPRRFGDGGCLTVPAIGGPVSAVGRTWVFGGVSRSIHDW